MTMINSKDIKLSDTRPSDIILDVTTLLGIVAHILDNGEISGRYAHELSWLIGSHRKRLEPLSELFERLEAAGAIDITFESFMPSLAAASDPKTDLYQSFFTQQQAQDDLALVDEIDATRAKLDEIRKEVSA